MKIVLRLFWFIQVIRPILKWLIVAFVGVGMSVTASEITKSCERAEHNYIGQMGEDGVMYYEEVNK